MLLNVSPQELEDYYLNQRLSSRKIAKIYNCAYSTIDRKIRLFGFKVRNRSESHVIYEKSDFSGNLSEKAYLIGFSIGDLRVRKFYKNSETVHVDCGSTRNEQIDLIERLFRRYGRVWISKPNKKGVTQIECFLNKTFDFLLELDKSSVPDWAGKNKLFFSNFLAGFVDAEGSIFISRNKAFFALGNYDIKLLKEIKYLLEKFGIKSPKIFCSVRKGFVASHGYRYNQDYWTLSISRKRELVNLFALVGPYLKHERRIACMELAKTNIEARNKLYGE